MEKKEGQMEKMTSEISIREHEGLDIVDFVFKRANQTIKEFKIYLAENCGPGSQQVQDLEKAMDYWDLHCSVFALRELRP